MYNILLTTHALTHFTGTETWTYAMVEELKRQGHTVTVFTTAKGRVAEKINARVITNFDGGNYDFAIVNHTTTYFELPQSLFKIFTSHSSIFDIERPPKDCAHVVYTSERIGTPVIRNGVDLNRFYYEETKEYPTILYLSNPAYSGGRNFVSRALGGYNLITLSKEVFEIEELIHKADIVISMSRGAIESMACGRHVIYADWRVDWASQFMGYGMITEENMEDFITGRCFTKLVPFTEKMLRLEIDKYDQTRSQFYRKTAETFFDIKMTAKQYIDIYEKNRCGVRV